MFALAHGHYTSRLDLVMLFLGVNDFQKSSRFIYEGAYA